MSIVDLEQEQWQDIVDALNEKALDLRFFGGKNSRDKFSVLMHTRADQHEVLAAKIERIVGL